MGCNTASELVTLLEKLDREDEEEQERERQYSDLQDRAEAEGMDPRSQEFARLVDEVFGNAS